MRTTATVYCAGCGIRNREAQALLEEAEARYDRLADAAVTMLNTYANWLDNPSEDVDGAIADLRDALGLPA